MPKSLVVVIGFVIISGWIYFNWQDSGVNPKVKQTEIILSGFEKPLARFKQDTARYPKPDEGIKALQVQPQDIQNWKGPYVDKDKETKDRWDTAFKYALEEKKYVLRSAGPDQIFGSEDDLVFRPSN